MKRYCAICHEVHDGFCLRKAAYIKQQYLQKARNSAADKFRGTQVWKKKARSILERDYHCCRVCLMAGIVNSRGLSVHHIVAISADYDKRLDDDNLITLCTYHHRQAERGIISARELREIALSDVRLPV